MAKPTTYTETAPQLDEFNKHLTTHTFITVLVQDGGILRG